MLENGFILGHSSYCYTNQNIYFFCSVHVPDTIFLSVSWELRSKYIWVCLFIRIDVTFYLGNEVVVQMLRRAPVYWPRSEHLMCMELFCLPPSIHMLMFISETVINLAKIAWVLCLISAYVSVNQYNTLCPIMKKAIPLHHDMLEFAVLQENNLHPPFPTRHTQSLRRH